MPKSLPRPKNAVLPSDPVIEASNTTPIDKSGPALLESVAIVFRLLDELSAARRPLGVTELADIVDEPKPRVYRHLASMRQMGAVEQDPSTEKYRLGAKLVIYGTAASEQFDLRAIADPYLTKLRDTLGQSAVLSVVTHDSALVVAAVDSNNGVCITVKPGNRVPAHCSAQGRLVLAFLPPEDQQRILRRKLQRFTARSITDPVVLARRLEAVRAQLYEDANGEVIDGINVLSAPIFRDNDVMVGAIGIIGPTHDVPSPPPPALLEHVQQAAAELSERLNCDKYRRAGLPSTEGGQTKALAGNHR
ncbi:IclR family transcriptional regulator [Caballeronia sp. dw_19]|uniref:IclR family transcriptional regulator n=1 Tax=Caballeronia sp. dw_19 TaxID=2719791 RepID=UPI001BD6A551|nr:IclR family transcriptional regulator [Caballeronia sp. dw_19]